MRQVCLLWLKISEGHEVLERMWVSLPLSTQLLERTEAVGDRTPFEEAGSK